MRQLAQCLSQNQPEGCASRPDHLLERARRLVDAIVCPVEGVARVLNLLALPAEVAEDACAEVLGLESNAVRILEAARRVGQRLVALQQALALRLREPAGARLEVAAVAAAVEVRVDAVSARQQLVAVGGGQQGFLEPSVSAAREARVFSSRTSVQAGPRERQPTTSALYRESSPL